MGASVRRTELDQLEFGRRCVLGGRLERRARRSERATRRGRRDASEQSRRGVRWGDRHGAMRSGCVGDATASSRPLASRAGGWARPCHGPHRSRRSERDARRRGRDASEPVRCVPRGLDRRCARRSELATRRGRRDASEQCRRGVRWGDRHGAMRSGCVGDATASPRPLASRAGGWARPCHGPHRPRRSERDARRRGRDASEPVRTLGVEYRP